MLKKSVMKWEYKVVNRDHVRGENKEILSQALEYFLNEEGDNGWELVKITTQEYWGSGYSLDVDAIFKRPKKS